MTKKGTSFDKDEHGHSHSHDTGNIKTAFWLNLSFSIIEIVGGIFTNSVAILSDALHDLGDSFSLGLAWYLQKVSKKKRDAKYSYGYRRFSLLGALINSVILLAGSIFMIRESVLRIMSPEEVNVHGMLLLSILGIVVNGAAVFKLKKGSSLNERTVALHIMEDVLGWVAVLIGSIVMMFFDVPWLDSVLSIAIASYILFNIYRNLRDTLRVILQGTPGTVSLAEVEEHIATIDNVKSIHDLHVWSMDGEYNILTVHVVAEDVSSQRVKDTKIRLRKEMKQLNIDHVTVEIESPDEVCSMDDCD